MSDESAQSAVGADQSTDDVARVSVAIRAAKIVWSDSKPVVGLAGAMYVLLAAADYGDRHLNEGYAGALPDWWTYSGTAILVAVIALFACWLLYLYICSVQERATNN